MCTAVAGACLAQAPKDQPAFEVASVKAGLMPNGSTILPGCRGGPGTPDPGRFTCTSAQLAMLIVMAYDIQFTQLEGPEWLKFGFFYDVAAKVPEGTAKDDFRRMLQTLLADRFHGAVHRETQQRTVYTLVAAKGGPKLRPSAPDAPTVNSAGGRQWAAAAVENHWRISVKRQSLRQLAGWLQTQLQATVADQTSLAGEFDMVLDYIPAGLPIAGQWQPSGRDSYTVPDLFGALEEQLGLRLEMKKAPQEMLIVDHAEKTPVEN